MRAPGSRPSPLGGEALEKLLRYAWPGNVRELENAIESSLALARGPVLRALDLSFEVPPGREPAPAPDSLPLDLEAYERCALERALRECGGDASLAARRLGIGRSTLYRKLAHHGLRPARALSAQRPIR